MSRKQLARFRKSKKSKSSAALARMVPIILRKLGGSDGVILGRIHAASVLNKNELAEAKLMIRGAVRFTNEFVSAQLVSGDVSPTLPNRFKWRNHWLDLQCSILGAVFITDKNGTKVIASDNGAIV